MDIAKIRAELGWYPKEDLASGLEKTVSWYLDHTDWLRAIIEEKDYQAWLELNYAERKGEA